MTNEYEREEAELEAQLALIRAKRAEAERLAALNAMCTVTIKRLIGTMVHISNEPYREDVLTIIKSIPGRVWNASERVNAISVASVAGFIERVTQLPNITVVYAENVERDIHDYLHAPDFSVDLKERFLTVKSSRRAYTYDLKQIPGYEYNWDKQLHLIPLTEAWRLHEFSKKSSDVSFVWSDTAADFTATQVGNRLKLDAIAQMEDLPMEIPEITANLKNYQRIGIEYFTLNGGRGILGDEMGTGKTLQMIALTARLKARALVVCPATLKENWLREIRKFYPTATTYTCQGESPTAFDIAAMISKKPTFIIINYDIIGRSVEVKTEKEREDGTVLHSSQAKWPWVEVLNLVSPDIVFLDEAHYIKNTDSNRSRAVRKLDMKRAISMTGTPVLNRPGELWPMLHLADPITFPTFETFKRQYTFDGRTVKNVDDLKALLKPLMIRRLKKDVIKELEPINRINSYYELSLKAKKLYERVLAGVYERLAAWNPNEGAGEQSVTNMLVQIQRLKQVVAYDGVEGTADLATNILDATPDGERAHKVLIFSQFKATTYACAQRLGAGALSFVRYAGSAGFVTDNAQEQQRKIDAFQNDPKINFLCVTEKTAKEGHNITAAQSVIFNDLFWTPAGHQQAEARAYGRVSDLHTIDSYYRIGTNTISERIMDLLAQKLSIIEQVVEGVEASRADSSMIKELLSSLRDEMWTLNKRK